MFDLITLMFAVGMAVTGTIGRTSTPDFWPLRDVARVWNVSLAVLEEVIRLGALEVETENGVRGLRYHRVQSGPGERVLLAVQRVKRANQTVQPQTINRDQYRTAAEHAAGIPTLRDARRTIDPEIIGGFIASGRLQSVFDETTGRRLSSRRDLKTLITSLGGMQNLQRLQLARDDQAREAAHNKQAAKDKAEQESSETDEERQKRLADAGCLPWREELKQSEAQKELDEINRRIRENY